MDKITCTKRKTINKYDCRSTCHYLISVEGPEEKSKDIHILLAFGLITGRILTVGQACFHELLRAETAILSEWPVGHSLFPF